MLDRVHDNDGIADLAGDICARRVRHKGDSPRPKAHLEILDDLVRSGIDNKNSAVIFRRHIDKFAVRTGSHAFRFFAHRYRLDDFTGGNIENAGRSRVFIGHVQQLAVLAQIETLRIVTALQDAKNLVRGDIKYADPVSGAIGWRQLALIDSGWGKWRSAEGDIDGLAVEARANTARPLAQWDSRRHFVCGRIDNGQVAGSFVGDIDAIGRQLLRGSRSAAASGEAGNKQ